MKSDSRIYVAGHTGMVGSAIVRQLRAEGFTNVITLPRADLDLRRQDWVQNFFMVEQPEYVFMAAAVVGGILANSTYPADFLLDNLYMELNVLDAAAKCRVKKLLFLGSSCIYPKHAPQPIREEALLSGPLEPTNEWYALAKIAGIKMCQALRRQRGCDFISAMPCNLYGPGDNYHPDAAHVIPGMLQRFHAAKLSGATEAVVCWGTGQARREFLHVEDLARACLLLMECYSDERPINVGSGEEVSIEALAQMVREAVGFAGELRWDTSKPDGTPRKVMDSHRVRELGWSPRVGLPEGLALAYADFLTMRPRHRAAGSD